MKKYLLRTAVRALLAALALAATREGVSPIILAFIALRFSTGSACACDAPVERVKGIEPSSQAWEARILPLNHTRSAVTGRVPYAGMGRNCSFER